jgi:DNA-directed RNA polymerase beta subunit
MPVAPAPPDNGDTVQIQAPPRLAFPAYLAPPQSNAQADVQKERSDTYGQLFHNALKQYIERASNNIPQHARHHDNGTTWIRYHQAAFSSVNPDPEVIRRHMITGQHLQENFARGIASPQLRQFLIQFNDLESLSTKKEVGRFMKGKRQKQRR